VEAANRAHTGPLLTHAVVPCFCDKGDPVETQTVSTTASHDEQGSSSREHPNGDDDPFPVPKTTEQISYPLPPAIFLPK
jgi:hypothetical protein